MVVQEKTPWLQRRTKGSKSQRLQALLRRAKALGDKHSASGNIKTKGHAPRPITLPTMKAPPE